MAKTYAHEYKRTPRDMDLIRMQAFDLYSRRWQIKDIAKHMKVELKTVSRWKKKYQWDKALQANLAVAKGDVFKRMTGVVGTMIDKFEEVAQKLEEKGLGEEEVSLAALNGLSKSLGTLVRAVNIHQEDSQPVLVQLAVGKGDSGAVAAAQVTINTGALMGVKTDETPDGDSEGPEADESGGVDEQPGEGDTE